MLAVSLPSFGVHPLSLLEQLLQGALSEFVSSSRSSVDQALSSYLFGTFDVAARHGGAPFSDTPGVVGLNHVLSAGGTALVLGVVLYSSLRTVVGASGDPRHYLHAVLPRSVIAVALALLSLPLIQQAINLNNALCDLLVGSARPSLASLPWSSPLSGPAIKADSANLFLLGFAAALILTVVILALGYVVRYTLLAVLCAAAPLAAIAWVLPETRGLARQWLRLFSVALFMQVGQLLVLRMAVALAFARDRGVTGMLYALASLYLALRVPGALNVASHYAASAEGAGRRWSRAVRRLAATEG